MRSVAVIASLDTKGAEAAELRRLIEQRGHRVIMVDVSTRGEARVPAEVSAARIAALGGADIEELRNSRDTNHCANVMIAGATACLRSLVAQGQVDGVVGLGGASATHVATSVMKGLPFGVPKLMVSSAASMPAYAHRYIGTADIAMLHSVFDVAGLSQPVRHVLARAAGAICGMVEAAEETKPWEASRVNRPVALTEFGFSELCCRLIRQMLEARGYEVVPFHAQGVGDRAMEELIDQGMFRAVVDIVPAGLGEELLGGNRAAGPQRLEAACRRGLPLVIAPSGFDMLSCGPLERRDRGDPLWVARGLANRKLFVKDALRVQARTNAEELRIIARAVAAKLNQATGPVRFLVPMGGWSSLSEPGGPLYDPEADAAFLEELKHHLAPSVGLRLVDAPLNSQTFAKACVDALEECLLEQGGKRGAMVG